MDRRLVKWGNGFGIRLTLEGARILGLREKDPVHAEVRPGEREFNPLRLRIVRGFGRRLSRDHDGLAGEAKDAGF